MLYKCNSYIKTIFTGTIKPILNLYSYLPSGNVQKNFPGGSDGKAYAYNAGDLGSIPGLGRSPGQGNGNSLQHSCLGDDMNRGACWDSPGGPRGWDTTQQACLSVNQRCPVSV